MNGVLVCMTGLGTPLRAAEKVLQTYSQILKAMVEIMSFHAKYNGVKVKNLNKITKEIICMNGRLDTVFHRILSTISKKLFLYFLKFLIDTPMYCRERT